MMNYNEHFRGISIDANNSPIHNFNGGNLISYNPSSSGMPSFIARPAS